MIVTPEQLAKPNTEHAHQCALFCWAAMNVKDYPKLRYMFAIPNGGQRGDGTRLGAKISGGRLIAEGVKRGVPDIFLPVSGRAGCGLFIEMKRPSMINRKDGGRTAEQIIYSAYLRDEGYEVRTCYGWEDAVNIIITYLPF